jgi:hypothetical protein
MGKFTDIMMLALTHKGRIRTEKSFVNYLMVVALTLLT